MKLFLLIFALCLPSLLFSQSIKIEEPEFAGIVVYVNDSVGAGLNLEKKECQIKNKMDASVYLVGLGKAHTFYAVEGNKSNFRLKKSVEHKFIIRVTDNSLDPSIYLHIYKMTPKNNTRLYEMASAGTFDAGGTNTKDIIPYTVKRYGTQSLIITVKDLVAGEYGINAATMNYYLFGID